MNPESIEGKVNNGVGKVEEAAGEVLVNQSFSVGPSPNRACPFSSTLLSSA